jgi:hypothetical protein
VPPARHRPQRDSVRVWRACAVPRVQLVPFVIVPLCVILMPVAVGSSVRNELNVGTKPVPPAAVSHRNQQVQPRCRRRGGARPASGRGLSLGCPLDAPRALTPSLRCELIAVLDGDSLRSSISSARSSTRGTRPRSRQLLSSTSRSWSFRKTDRPRGDKSWYRDSPRPYQPPGAAERGRLRAMAVLPESPPVAPPWGALWMLLTERERGVHEEGAALQARSRSRAV